MTVYEGLPKADKLDFIAQKLTELGATIKRVNHTPEYGEEDTEA